MSGIEVPPLKFAPNPFLAFHHWVGLSALGAPVSVSLQADALEDRIRPMLGDLQLRTEPDTPEWLARIVAKMPDDIGQKIADRFAQPITTNRLNIATGKPGEIGSIGVGGQVSYDGPNDLVPGTALPVLRALDFMAVTKRFKYNVFRSVQVGVIFDPTALENHAFNLMVSGVSATAPMKIRGWNDARLTVKAGRDQFGDRVLTFYLSANF